MRSAILAALAAMTLLVLHACTPEFDEEAVEVTPEPSTAPAWCPTTEEGQEVFGAEFGTWQREENHDCLMRTYDDEGVPTAQFFVFENTEEDDHWADAVSGEGRYEWDRTERISEDAVLTYPGANRDTQTMCELVTPETMWGFNSSGYEGACDITIEIHTALTEETA